MELVTLTLKEYREVVRHCAVNGWVGGKVHDAVHLRCAQKAGCDRVYTFNVRDFRTLAPPELADRVALP
jgi:predicted nucleic acid-binding protein